MSIWHFASVAASLWLGLYGCSPRFGSKGSYGIDALSSSLNAGINADDLLAPLAANQTPWLGQGSDASPTARGPAGTSQQYFPLFIGASVRDLVINGTTADHPTLPNQLKDLGKAQAVSIAKSLHKDSAELLAWPSEDWDGQPNWVFARWRETSGDAWQWLTGKNSGRRYRRHRDESSDPLMPELYDPSKAKAKHDLFADFLDDDDLYQQPGYANCVYVDSDSGKVALAWPPASERDQREEDLSDGSYKAYCMNQPPRFNLEPVAFVIKVNGENVKWPDEIDWAAPYHESPDEVDQALVVRNWPDHFAKHYEEDDYIVSGESKAHFPISGDEERFKKKGAYQTDSDLERMADYFEERYKDMGIPTARQRFTWRGIAQSNVVAVIKGASGSENLAPVVMADHYDTAVEEDTFANTGKRVTTHGADDNGTATSSLLQAALALKGRNLKRDVWLVHLTGEEFPSDGLGAWHFLSLMMRKQKDIHAVFISDFIGWHHKDDLSFQVSPTSVPGSEHLAALALDAAGKVAPDIKAHYRARDDERNSVFQTDVQEFEYYGIPGVLFNEHMNYADPSTANPNYHQSTDVAANVDFDFSSQVAKIAIETVARMANE